MNTRTSKRTRRYDLDWLRVIVFGLLIFYHVGMFFVPWGWHIKNNITYDWLVWPMAFVNQWRLPILFVISGMGTRFALSYRTSGQYIKERLSRLGIPLLVGMALIVPPQIYLERLVNHTFQGSYWEFLATAAFTQGIYPIGNISWHHLWFLPYLLIFSLILTPIFIRLRDRPNGRFLTWLKNKLKNPWWLYLAIIPLWLAESFLEPFFNETHALIGDWYALTYYISLFLIGYILISIKENWWIAMDLIKHKALILGILCFSLQVVLWTWDPIVELPRHLTEALIKITNVWSWILVLFGYGAKFLNKPSTLLRYCNTAVYPFYIFHQTVTIILAYFMMNKDWNFTIKFTLLSIGTFSISWVLYEFVRRIKILRPLFGLKS